MPDVYLYLLPRQEAEFEIRTDSWELDKPFIAFTKRIDAANERKKLGEIKEDDVAKEVIAGRDEYQVKTSKILSDLLDKM